MCITTAIWGPLFKSKVTMSQIWRKKKKRLSYIAGNHGMKTSIDDDAETAWKTRIKYWSQT